MIDETITKIEAQLKAAKAIKPERREELMKLLVTLKEEVSVLPEPQGEQARSIAKFAEVSAHEATRSTQDQKLLELSLEGLRSSAQGFEQSHPTLVRIVNSISSTLSNLGI